MHGREEQSALVHIQSPDGECFVLGRSGQQMERAAQAGRPRHIQYRMSVRRRNSAGNRYCSCATGTGNTEPITTADSRAEEGGGGGGGGEGGGRGGGGDGEGGGRG